MEDTDGAVCSVVVHTHPSTQPLLLQLWLEWDAPTHTALQLPHWDTTRALDYAHCAAEYSVGETTAPTTVHLAWRTSEMARARITSPHGGLFVTLSEVFAVCDGAVEASIWHIETLPVGTAAACMACTEIAEAWRTTKSSYRVEYHGTNKNGASRIANEGITASKTGMMGPGVYLGGFFKAARYAMFNSAATNPAAARGGTPVKQEAWVHSEGAVARVMVDMRDARIALATPRTTECGCVDCAAEARCVPA